MQWRRQLGIRVTDSGRKVDFKLVYASRDDIARIVLAFADDAYAAKIRQAIGRAKAITLFVSTEG